MGINRLCSLLWFPHQHCSTALSQGLLIGIEYDIASRLGAETLSDKSASTFLSINDHACFLQTYAKLQYLRQADAMANVVGLPAGALA